MIIRRTNGFEKEIVEVGSKVVIVLKLNRHIVHTILLTYATGRNLMLCHDETVLSGTIFESLKLREDASAMAVEQKDAEVGTFEIVPEGVLVIEETEVARDQKAYIVGQSCSKPHSSGDRAIDAINASVAEDHAVVNEHAGEADCRAIGKAEADIAALNQKAAKDGNNA